MANHPRRRKSPAPRRLYTLAYRYIPGARGDGSSLDHGAIMTQEFESEVARDQRLAQLKADPRIQWARAAGGISATSSYGQ